ncbi:hypothetical protein [Puniceicoccus vermicola]|uniref:HTH araC/xylS-type domain-containing protein n=1 Tax=Puniceicoccus vermicola TaxID=388746 RepID=A0A7X1AZ81_9BACT|nr:hypothetical protein [Puniceicoccus vermicola]MBC2602696.1 hypothetical protein [Puniceicoccus vermicola]
MPPQGRTHVIQGEVQLWSAHFYFESNQPGSELNFREVVQLRSPKDPKLNQATWKLDKVVSTRLSAHEAHIPGISCSVNDYIAGLGAFIRWLEALLEVLATEKETYLEPQESNSRAHEIHEHLSNAPLDAPLCLQTIADRANLTVRHMNRIYSQATHLTPTRYFERRRFT